MQKLKNFILVVACIISSFAANAQSGTSTMAGDPKPLSDQTMSKKLQDDLTGRATKLGNGSVDWYDAGNGYYGTYSIDDKTYMARYDRQGNYVDTYTQGNWNMDNVPASLKTAYNGSEYKNQDVKAYWVSSNKKGYYLEVAGKNGKTSRVWSDQNGKFSTNPPTPKS